MFDGFDPSKRQKYYAPHLEHTRRHIFHCLKLERMYFLNHHIPISSIAEDFLNLFRVD